MDKHEKLKKYKQKAKELNDILNEWDPIGILPFKGGQKDEYDCFINPILTALEHGIEKKDLIKVLENHLEEHVGLPKRYGKDEEIAAKILKWWENNG